MDQATTIYYALGYIASVIAFFLLLLPVILSFVLLLLLAAAIQVVVLFLKTAALVAYRTLALLSRNVAGRIRRRWGGGRPVPH